MFNDKLKTEISFVLLALCTFKRPNIFAKCLESIAAIKIPADIKVGLLVIDNDENASAEKLINEYRSKINIPLYYFVENKRGLANARNRLISEAVNLNASHIAMFDDDILLPENWLINYINYYNQNEKAVIITAASYSKFTSPPPKYIEKNDLFKCSTTKKTGSIRNDAASGNVFFPVSVITDLGLNFNSEYVFMGGEDGKFFEEASKKGAVIVWNNDCFNWELNGSDKINVEWILRRSYYNGFSAAFGAVKRKKSKFAKILYTFRQNISFVVNCMLLPFSILFGFTGFVNFLGITAKSLGRLVGSTQKKTLNYYEKVYGD